MIIWIFLCLDHIFEYLHFHQLLPELLNTMWFWFLIHASPPLLQHLIHLSAGVNNNRLIEPFRLHKDNSQSQRHSCWNWQALPLHSCKVIIPEWNLYSVSNDKLSPNHFNQRLEYIVPPIPLFAGVGLSYSSNYL